jgi:Na+-transporting NADH:ubiquinone oxidoreductase subunit B
VQISFPSVLSNHPLWPNLNGYAGTRFFAEYHQQGVDGLTSLNLNWWDAFLGSTQGLIGTTSVLAVLIGAAVLIYAHIASWRLLAGQLIGVIVVATICNIVGDGILDMPWYWHLVLGSFAFAAVFIATDPSSSSSTNAGRWVQGVLAGGLVVFIRVVNPSHPDSVIPVLLLVSILAPLIDHVVMWFNIRRRALRHG